MSNTSITELGGVVRHSLTVPMRDGVRLATDLYLPENLGPHEPGPLPVLLERTPYGKNEETRRERSAANHLAPAHGKGVGRAALAARFLGLAGGRAPPQHGPRAGLVGAEGPGRIQGGGRARAIAHG